MGSDRQQRFSFRKYAVGLVSVVVGCLFYGPAVLAQEQGGTPQQDLPARVEQGTEGVAEAETGSQDSNLIVSVIDQKHQLPEAPDSKSSLTESENADKKVGDVPSTYDKSSEEKSIPEAVATKDEGLEGKKGDQEVSEPEKEGTSSVIDSAKEEARVQALVRLESKHSETPVGAEKIKERLNENLPVKSAVLKELEEKGIQYKKLADFDLLFNGFVLETSYKDALKIRKVARVENVDITPLSATAENQDLPKKQTTLVPTKVSDENELINLQPLWDKGIKGQGSVVAVLDTGLDYDHNFFSLTDKSKAKYKNKEQMEAAMKKAGITYGKWYNDKVIYAYNYSDMNDEIKEDDPRSHGTHVAGSAVGNATKPVPTGELLKGVAPEAQLIFMRVFSDKKGMTEQGFVVAKAVEDAVKLGADTINMSFGGVNGAEADTHPLTRKAFEFARKSGVVINAAAGNYAVSGYWQAKPKADAPDTGTMDEPAVEKGVLAIGAFNNSITHETKIRLEVPALKDKEEFQNGLVDLPVYRLIFPVEGPQSYVYVPKGGEDAYRTPTVKGKIALVESGGDVSD